MLKRAFDILVSGAALLALSPLIFLLYILVRRDLGHPAFFRQERPGIGGRPFTMIKFRTMRDARGRDGRLLDDAERLTSFGKFLRSSSLDELPELWNVFVGEMSLVGPRPLLMEYLPLYSETQARRHEVRPGLTGWAQVNGRNRLTWDEKFALDVEYVDRRSFWFDLRILFLTVKKVVQSDGIDEDGVVGQTPFRGNEERGRQ